MGKRKFAFIMFAVVLSIATILSAGKAWAAGPCLSPENQGLPLGECNNLDGYDVKVVRSTTPTAGLFPFQENGDSIFPWAISGAGAKQNINTIDMKIPVNIGSYEDLDSNIEVSLQGCGLLPKIAPRQLTGWRLFDKGLGGIIGFSEFDYYVLRVIPPLSCRIKPTDVDVALEVRFKEKVLVSGLNTFFIRAGLGGQSMNLLGPSLASSSTDSTNQPPLRSYESFKLGDRNCSMVVTLNSDGSIANAFVRPLADDGSGCSMETLLVEPIKKTLVCDKDTEGNPVNCTKKAFVEQNIIDKAGDESRYCYYTTTGQRVCKTF